MCSPAGLRPKSVFKCVQDVLVKKTMVRSASATNVTLARLEYSFTISFFSGLRAVGIQAEDQGVREVSEPENYEVQRSSKSA